MGTESQLDWRKYLPKTSRQPTKSQPPTENARRLAEAQANALVQALVDTIDAFGEPESEVGHPHLGTKMVGFVQQKDGPFLCINCKFSNREGIRCSHPEVFEDPETTKDGKLVVIEPGDCCNEFFTRSKD